VKKMRNTQYIIIMWNCEELYGIITVPTQ